VVQSWRAFSARGILPAIPASISIDNGGGKCRTGKKAGISNERIYLVFTWGALRLQTLTCSQLDMKITPNFQLVFPVSAGNCHGLAEWVACKEPRCIPNPSI